MVMSTARPDGRARPPAITPRDLTIPEPGSTTARDVLSLAMRRLLAEFRRLPRLLPATASERREVESFAAIVDALYASQPGLVASLLRRPTVGTLARCLRRHLGPSGDPAEALSISRALRATVGFELALMGALPGSLRVSRPPSRALSLGARVALDLPDDAAVTFDGQRARIEHAGAARDVDLAPVASGEATPEGFSRPYHPLVDGMALALADNNPLQMYEAHPDKFGNAIDLGGRDVSAWVDELRACLDLIERHLPELRAEVGLFIQQVVPVGYDDHKHLSASYQEDIGTIYMTLHPNRMTMTEALIHEFSHNKLNALFELDPVLENAFWPLYTSPVRPDPRPLHGIVLAVHAFQPVARLYERMTEAGEDRAKSPDFQRRFKQVRQLNHLGATVVLDNGRPTDAGRALLDEFRRWDVHFGERELADVSLDH